MAIYTEAQSIIERMENRDLSVTVDEIKQSEEARSMFICSYLIPMN